MNTLQENRDEEADGMDIETAMDLADQLPPEEAGQGGIGLPGPQNEAFSQNSEDQEEEPTPAFPGDYNELQDAPQAEEELQEDQNNAQESQPRAQQSHYLEELLQDQQEFINVLETAENQLMLDESFILLVSRIANKNKEQMFDLDYRDPALEGKKI